MFDDASRALETAALACFAAGLLVAGCSGGAAPTEDASSGSDAGASASGPTYHDDVRPLVEENCATCHSPNDIGGLVFTNYDDLSANADLALSAIESGKMPPWPPDRECRQYRNPRSLTDEEIATFRQWVEAGTPEGKAPEESTESQSSAPSPDIESPDLVGDIESAYTPREDLDDDYRCFPLDTEFDETTYLTASDVAPDVDALVHHANVFRVPPFATDTVQELNAEHDAPGYPCFGDAGFAGASFVGSWVPGARPIRAPDDSAVVVPKGSRLVLQAHFNTLYAEPEPVAPAFKMKTTDEPPEKRLFAKGFANADFSVPPGEERSKHTQVFTNNSDSSWKFVGAAGHMHLLGEEIRLDVVRDGEERACMLDIPDWDFDWQMLYWFREGESLEIPPGDGVELTCVYDNSPDNQPVVDGSRQSPRRVTWGPGSTDEMCLGFGIAVEDYEPKDGICSPFSECRANAPACQSDPHSFECVLDCAVKDMDCATCFIDAAGSCGEEYCASTWEAGRGCLVDCALDVGEGGDVDGCMRERCPDRREALETCIKPHFANGNCDSHAASCDTTLSAE